MTGNYQEQKFIPIEDLLALINKSEHRDVRLNSLIYTWFANLIICVGANIAWVQQGQITANVFKNKIQCFVISYRARIHWTESSCVIHSGDKRSGYKKGN